ncbi:SnoaL-like protein [Micromonospora pisi]|uniref:SnoaL-like protein n=1 Tax=Micromonospora pisi TaxID=589240 RepID=A0A495JEC7_9ACTN|nr:nuclear transport factor 2 family protein [Micromonospora pisi]RKR87356.1 SnoaL-like protein [Micromonospora pisi]
MITELQHAVENYAHALDELNVPALEAILTQDTTWTFTVPGQGVLGPVAGRTTVLDFVRDGHAAQTGRVRHQLSNVVVRTADANSAQVQAYLTQTRNTGGNVQVISTGVYTFGLRRSDSGWRIAELTLALDNALPGSVGGP